MKVIIRNQAQPSAAWRAPGLKLYFYIYIAIFFRLDAAVRVDIQSKTSALYTAG